MKTLAEWKAAQIDAEIASQATAGYSAGNALLLTKAAEFAKRKVEQIEEKLFSVNK